MGEPEELVVRINERETVTALLYSAAKRTSLGLTLVLGHGAGGNQLSPFMRQFATGLAARGLDAITFNFLYSEQRRRAPDPKARLETCYRAVIATALEHKEIEGNRLTIGGKSMGGRIGSQVAAALPATPEDKEHETESGLTANDLAALVFLGYPLHPPGKPEQLRAEHLKHIQAPMLFVQGSRDAFGTAEELRSVITRLHLPATLYLIDGGDHSFKAPKSSSVSQQEIYEEVMDQIVGWLRQSSKTS